MLKTFSITDIGRNRKINQDYVYASEEPVGHLSNLFIVADGMGGHNAGDFAAKVAVETMTREISASAERNPSIILDKAITAANECVFKIAGNNPELEGMGTTVVAATCIGKYLQVANVGDSRLYVINKEIKQITRDHSLVEEMVRLGGLEPEKAKNHPRKNVITRAVGVSATVEVDFFTVEVVEGDIILMCSDGLTNMLEDGEICKLVSGARNLEEKAKELVRIANENGGKDNISVILINPLA